MIYVISHYWIFAALAGILGLAVSWLTCAPPRETRLGWLLWGLLALAVGLALAFAGVIPGLAGHALEIALLLFIAYLIGCGLGCVLKQALGAAPAASRSSDTPASAKPARLDGKTAALAGVGASAAPSAAATRVARDAAKAKARAEADARSHAKFVEEEAVRAKAEADRLAREQAQAEEKARREAALIAREEELARSGKSTQPARDFSVAKGDPLTWIDRIGPHAESRLNELGVRKFAQIAAWTPSNGRWIDEQFGEPGRVAREDWTAQAQRLARGDLTDYARGVKSGAIQIDDAPPAKPKAEKTGIEKVGDAPAAPGGRRGPARRGTPDKPAIVGAAAAMANAAATAADAAERNKPAADEIVAAPIETGTAVAAPPEDDATAPVVYPPARPRASAGHGGVVAGDAPAALPPPSARALVVQLADDSHRPLADAEGEGADDLKWILGVGPVNERVLNDLGVRRFAQIAAWTPQTAQWVGRHMRLPGRIEREGWIAQARLLAAGVMTDHARAARAGDIDLADADAMLDEEKARRFVEALPQTADAVESEADHDGARPLGLLRPRAERADDLKLINGVGLRNEQRLNALGVWHFDQIAAWSADNVRWVGSYLAFPGRIDREGWIEQAKRLARGETAEAARAPKDDEPAR